MGDGDHRPAQGRRIALSAAAAEDGEHVHLDGKPAGTLIPARPGRFGPMNQGCYIEVHKGCRGRIVAGRSGAWCTRCLAEPEAEDREYFEVVLHPEPGA